MPPTREPPPGRVAPTEVEGDCTSSHLRISDTANERVPRTVLFDPQVTGVRAAKVLINLNRRDRATVLPSGGGAEEGISPPPRDGIKARQPPEAYPVSPVAGGYVLTLTASKTGAYRPASRYRLTSDPPGTDHWYGDAQNAQGIAQTRITPSSFRPARPKISRSTSRNRRRSSPPVRRWTSGEHLPA
jgi:hypothetical protein